MNGSGEAAGQGPEIYQTTSDLREVLRMYRLVTDSEEFDSGLRAGIEAMRDSEGSSSLRETLVREGVVPKLMDGGIWQRDFLLGAAIGATMQRQQSNNRGPGEQG